MLFYITVTNFTASYLTELPILTRKKKKKEEMITPHENKINAACCQDQICQYIYNKFFKNSSFHNKASKWLEKLLRGS